MKLAKNVRTLKPLEKTTAFSVFLDTINYDCVRITDGLGGNNLAFTFPGAPMSAMGILSEFQIGLHLAGFAGGFVSDLLDRIVYINFGPSGYGDALGQSRTFIHEMTHVWQYMHGLHVAADSVSQRLALGDDAAYHYEKPAGLDWDLYNVEQQAEIVADWFWDANLSSATNAGNVEHPNYKYIRDHIRANKPT